MGIHLPSMADFCDCDFCGTNCESLWMKASAEWVGVTLRFKAFSDLKIIAYLGYFIWHHNSTKDVQCTPFQQLFWGLLSMECNGNTKKNKKKQQHYMCSMDINPIFILSVTKATACLFNVIVLPLVPVFQCNTVCLWKWRPSDCSTTSSSRPDCILNLNY